MMLRLLVAAMVVIPLIACIVVLVAVSKDWLPNLAALGIALGAAVSEAVMAVSFGVFAFTSEGPVPDIGFDRQILAIGVFGWMAGAIFLGASILLIERYSYPNDSRNTP